MMNRFLTILIFIGFSASAFASNTKAPSCEKWLKALITYEKMSNGRIVWKFDTYNLGNWDANEQFTTLVLIKKLERGAPAPILEVKYTADAGGKSEFQTYRQLLPFEMDARLMEFDDFKPKQFFRFEEPGRFTLTLKSGSTVLCSHTGKFGVDD